MKGRITVEGDNNAKKKLTFKNNAPFRSRISKINNSLLEYSNHYSITLGNLWNYHEINDDANENNAARNKININKTIASSSFKYKTKLAIIIY